MLGGEVKLNNIDFNSSDYILDKEEFVPQSHKSFNKLNAISDNDRESVVDLGRLIAKVDAMSEEMKRQREVIADLEEEKNQLLKYKKQVEGLRNECFTLRNENSELRNTLNKANKKINDIEYTRKIEIEKLKNSFDEMDELLEKEKEAHKIKEQKLMTIINSLEAKYKSTTEEIIKRNQKQDEYMSKLSMHKENEKKLQDSVKNSKKREMELKNQLNKITKELQAKNKELLNMVEKIGSDNDGLKLQIEAEKKKVHFYTYRMI